MSAKSLAVVCALLIAASNVFAADTPKKKDDKKWDVEAPLGPTKTVEFTTDEGTWMNLDVSPDGKEIVFDLLGDIYQSPAAKRHSCAADPPSKCSRASRPTASASATHRIRTAPTTSGS
jgi:hypothetical protein